MKMPLQITLTLALIAISYTAITTPSSQEEKYYISAYKKDMTPGPSRIWVYQEGRESSSATFTKKTGTGDLFYYPGRGRVSFYFCPDINANKGCNKETTLFKLEDKPLANVPEGSKIKIYNANKNPLQGDVWVIEPEPSSVKTVTVKVVKTDPNTHEDVWTIKPSRIDNVFATNTNLHNAGIKIKKDTSFTKGLKVPVNSGDVYIIVEGKGIKQQISPKFRAGEIRSGDTLEVDRGGNVKLVHKQ
jgi:hypothetical protein